MYLGNLAGFVCLALTMPANDYMYSKLMMQHTTHG